jgi:CheY-like chemotaxis protein
MVNILMVSSAAEPMAELARFLEQQPALSFSHSKNGAAGLNEAGRNRFDLVIADETLDDMTGLEFANQLVTTDPMANLALVSSLSADDFHQASEGLGVLAQLPVQPNAADGRKLLDQLTSILQLTGKRSS